MRRLDAALSNAPLKTLDESDRGSPLPPAEEASRKVRKVRKRNFYHKEHKEHKEMEGGNGVRFSERSYALFEG